MIIWLIKYLMYKYIYFYLFFAMLTPFLLVTLCSFLLNYVDRRCLRENGKILGIKFYGLIKKYYMNYKNDKIKNIINTLVRHTLFQLNSMTEFATGFTDGLLGNKQYYVIKIKEIEKPIEVIKEVEKMVYVDKIVYVDKLNGEQEKREEKEENKEEEKEKQSEQKKHDNENNQTFCTKYKINKNETNVFELFEKTNNNIQNQKQVKLNIFFEDAKNDEKMIRDIKNKIPLGGKKLNIRIIPKSK